MSYSVDFRECVISYIESGGSRVSASKIFKVGVETVRRWISLKKETGNVSPKSHGGGHPQKINLVKLKNYVDANPDKTLQEIGVKFSVSHVSIFSALKKLNYVSKKRRYYTPKGMKRSGGNTSKQ
jgi:putative transposase